LQKGEAGVIDSSTNIAIGNKPRRAVMFHRENHNRKRGIGPFCFGGAGGKDTVHTAETARRYRIGIRRTSNARKVACNTRTNALASTGNFPASYNMGRMGTNCKQGRGQNTGAVPRGDQRTSHSQCRRMGLFRKGGVVQANCPPRSQRGLSSLRKKSWHRGPGPTLFPFWEINLRLSKSPPVL